MLVHLSELLKDAQEKKYALGAFNIENLETTLGVVNAAVKKVSPIILQVSETSIQYAGLKAITSIVQTIASVQAGDIPIALHLDHGRTFRAVAECVRAGFSSIMMDASDMPLTENIILTKQAVDFAHRKAVLTQGELGVVKGLEEIEEEERHKLMTDPEEAEKFVKATGVDTLAVAVGNVHGILKMQKGNPGLDLDRLEAIHKLIPDTPLVLHGASGLPEAQIQKGIVRGISIINIDTELRLAFTNTLRATLINDPEEFDPREVLAPSIFAIQKVAEEKIEMFGSAGAAKP
ncbi:class II fructose-bisphosphate aldolase [Patescibacteria group bacterium]|nr:class II fructose-bisphosphate aldolase [Patescibacteria group bacterium]